MHNAVAAEASTLRPFECGDGLKVCLDDADFDPVAVMDALLGEGAHAERASAAPHAGLLTPRHRRGRAGGR